MLEPDHLHLEAAALQDAYDRVPLGFHHDLHTLALWQPDALTALAERFEGHRADYFVAGSAAAPGTAFYAVPTLETTPAEALARLDAAPTRLLLKRPENHDPAFRALLDAVFDQVARLHGSLRREDVVRLESAILVTSAAATTPFHFDPEVGFFSQIEGRKTYHLYAPEVLSEAELEAFYQLGHVDIGQVDLAKRDKAKEHVFALTPGLGLHQPQNAPHWVQTHAERSISWTVVFETRQARLRSRARGLNHYLRRAGLRPRAPGVAPFSDAMKGRAMQVVSRVRRSL